MLARGKGKGKGKAGKGKGKSAAAGGGGGGKGKGKEKTEGAGGDGDAEGEDDGEPPFDPTTKVPQLYVLDIKDLTNSKTDIKRAYAHVTIKPKKKLNYGAMKKDIALKTAFLETAEERLADAQAFYEEEKAGVLGEDDDRIRRMLLDVNATTVVRDKALALQTRLRADMHMQMDQSARLARLVENLRMQRRVLTGRNPASSFPDRHVAFAVTRVEGFDRMYGKFRDMTVAAVLQQNRIVRRTARRFHGFEVSTTGADFVLAFASTVAAVQFALQLQEALMKAKWSPVLLAHEHGKVEKDEEGEVIFSGLRVCVGVHHAACAMTLDPLTDSPTYPMQHVTVAAGMALAGAGGHVLLSEAAWEEAQERLEELDFPVNQNLGRYVLRGTDSEAVVVGLCPQTLRGRMDKIPPLDLSRKGKPLIDLRVVHDPHLADATSAMIGRLNELRVAADTLLLDMDSHLNDYRTDKDVFARELKKTCNAYEAKKANLRAAVDGVANMRTSMGEHAESLQTSVGELAPKLNETPALEARTKELRTEVGELNQQTIREGQQYQAQSDLLVADLAKYMDRYDSSVSLLKRVVDWRDEEAMIENGQSFVRVRSPRRKRRGDPSRIDEFISDQEAYGSASDSERRAIAQLYAVPTTPTPREG